MPRHGRQATFQKLARAVLALMPEPFEPVLAQLSGEALEEELGVGGVLPERFAREYPVADEIQRVVGQRLVEVPSDLRSEFQVQVMRRRGDAARREDALQEARSASTGTATRRTACSQAPRAARGAWRTAALERGSRGERSSSCRLLPSPAHRGYRRYPIGRPRFPWCDAATSPRCFVDGAGWK